jgi:hypothetical protein
MTHDRPLAAILLALALTVSGVTLAAGASAPPLPIDPSRAA